MHEDRSRTADDEPSFRTMADALGLGMAYQVLTAPDGVGRRFTYVGGLCREMTGLAPDEVLADAARLYDQILPEHRGPLEMAEAAATAMLSRFEAEVRMRRADGAVCWRRIASTPRPLADGWIAWDGILMDITEARRMAEGSQDQGGRALLLEELAHRAKNGIQVMMAIVAHTARGASSVEDFESVLTARLRAMADSQDLVTASGGGAVILGDVVAKTLTPFDAARFDVDADISGVTVAADVAVALGLLLHELSTNAVKYGALSAPTGRVAIRRSQGPDGLAVLSWAERGGPEVRPGKRKGFGSRLLDVSLRPQGGRVEAVFTPAGFMANIHFPVAGARSNG